MLAVTSCVLPAALRGAVRDRFRGVASGIAVALAADMTFTTIPTELLVTATGGMDYSNFRRSTNIEDRRSPAAIQQDNAWFGSQPHSTPSPTPTAPTPSPTPTSSGAPTSLFGGDS